MLSSNNAMGAVFLFNSSASKTAYTRLYGIDCHAKPIIWKDRCHAQLVLAFLLLGLVWGDAQAQAMRPVADLVADLRKADDIKLKAIEELAALGSDAGAAVPPMIDLLHTNNEDVRLHVIMAMAKIRARR